MVLRPLSKYFISYNPTEGLYRTYKNKEGIRPLIHSFQERSIKVSPYNEEFNIAITGELLKIRKLGELYCYITKKIFDIYNFPSSAFLKKSNNNVLPGNLFVAIRLPTYLPVNIVEDLKAKAIAENEKCGICLEPLTTENSIVTSCGHLFIRGAFEQWRQISTKCPICRSSCDYQ
jgi:hypothetical protein